MEVDPSEFPTLATVIHIHIHTYINHHTYLLIYLPTHLGAHPIDLMAQPFLGHFDLLINLT